jgi:hypothetical protein
MSVRHGPNGIDAGEVVGLTLGVERTRLGAANAFPDATLVAAHSEGWVYLKETQDQLAEVFALLDLAGRRPRLRASYRGRARSAGR